MARKKVVKDRGVWRSPHDVGSDRWGSVWRVWMGSNRYGERYYDVEAWGHAVGAGYDAVESAEGSTQYFWVDRWQLLAVPAGNEHPSRWFRFRLWIRELERKERRRQRPYRFNPDAWR